MKKTTQVLSLILLISGGLFAQKGHQQIAELNKNKFKQKVWNYDKNKTFSRQGNLPIILDFYATWCQPCKRLEPILESIQLKYKNQLVIYSIDVDKEPELARLFNVQAMPTLIFAGSKTKYNIELGFREYNEMEACVVKYLINPNK